MRELAKKRLNENLKQSVKYLTLVFNDFFILALIFLVGALMFWYAEAMKTMPTNLWFYKPLVGFILWLPFLTGKLVTLIKEADMQFLFTQDERMEEYLKPMYRYSLVLPFILEILLAGIVFPFATIKAGIGAGNYFLYVLALLILKCIELAIETQNLYFGKRYSSWMVNLAALVLSVLGSYLPVALIVVCLVGEYLASRVLKEKKTQLFDWRYAVESERARKERVYSVFSMFTDVAEKQVNIKRRKYLDFLLPKSIAKENPNLFLYRRSLLRNPEYLNLLVRMTAFAILISWLVQDWRWALGLSCLVIFLTVYQLLPMATEFDRNFMYRVYPIERQNRGKDLVKVLTLGLLIQWLLISVFWLVVLPINLNLFEAIGILLVFTALVTAIYLPNRVRKMNQKNFGIRLGIEKMRLRNKPWAVKLVNDHPESVLQNPDPEKKIDWAARFGNDHPIEIEVGSGKGHFITTLAENHPDKNYVALELQTTAAGIILRTKLEKGLDNLQILRGDAADINCFFDKNTTDVIYLNFSDPWPKSRHEKRRLTYKSFLSKYEQVLKPEGHIEFKTDNSGLFAYSVQSMNNYGMHFDFVSVDLHHEKPEIVEKNIETEYEHKFAAKGNPIYALHASFEADK